MCSGVVSTGVNHGVFLTVNQMLMHVQSLSYPSGYFVVPSYPGCDANVCINGVATREINAPVHTPENVKCVIRSLIDN